MKMFIKLGNFSIKLLYPLICICILILESIAENRWYPKKRGNLVISLFINSFAKTLNIFIYIPLKIFYYKSNLLEKVEEGERVKQNKLKNNILLFLVFALIQVLYNIMYVIYYIKSREENNKRIKNNEEELIFLAHSYGVFFLENLQIIVIFIITKFILNYEYIKQSIICLVLFTILSIVNDIINYDNFFDALGGFVIFMLIFINLLCESIAIVFQKILMESFYFSPFLTNFVYGIIDFIFVFILGIITFAKDGLFCYTEEKKICILASFMDYFKDSGSVDIISFIASISFKIAIYILSIYTIYYFTPNHILLTYIVGKFFENSFERKKNEVESYIVFIFLLISFIFYLEIFELNFCGINKNTKKSIITRAWKEFIRDKKLLKKLEDNERDGDSNTDNLTSDPEAELYSTKTNDIGGYKFYLK